MRQSVARIRISHRRGRPPLDGQNETSPSRAGAIHAARSGPNDAWFPRSQHILKGQIFLCSRLWVTHHPYAERWGELISQFQDHNSYSALARALTSALRADFPLSTDAKPHQSHTKPRSTTTVPVIPRTPLSVFHAPHRRAVLKRGRHMTDKMTSLKCRHSLKYNPLEALVLLSTYQHYHDLPKAFPAVVLHYDCEGSSTSYQGATLWLTARCGLNASTQEIRR